MELVLWTFVDAARVHTHSLFCAVLVALARVPNAASARINSLGARCRISLVENSSLQLLDWKSSDRAWRWVHQVVQSPVRQTPAKFAGKSHDW
jgi:hypothetical protein